MRGCGFARRPAEGTRDREVMDRFADLLANLPGRKATKAEIDAGRSRSLNARERYQFGFLAWRMSTTAIELSVRLQEISS